jgi:alpha-L-fucosidase 2
MKRSIVIILLLLGTFVRQVTAQVQNKVNWDKLLSRNDLVFDSLSTKWEEGAFLGNGLLGVMVYRENANTLRFDLGRTDVVDHIEGINASIGRARLPIGRFLMEVNGAIKGIKLRLNLLKAELEGTITTDKGIVHFSGLVAATKDLIILNTRTDKNEKLVNWQWKPEPALSSFLSLGRDSASKYPANPSNQLFNENGIHYNHQPLRMGGGYTTAWKELSSGHTNTLVITIANSYPKDDSKEIAKKLLSAVTAPSVKDVTSAHDAHWLKFYRKSFISVPDSRLESFWWIQQYKMASATRIGAYPIDLMGPWYKATPWPKYWWNLNIQLTYYPFFSSNHIELVQPLMKMINDNIDNLSKNAPAPYQHNSAALGRSGPYTMTSGIKVLKGNDSTGNSAASLELGNLTWLLHVYYQAYEHTLDKQIIKNLFPVLTRSVNYYLNIMSKESDGKYHLPYTYSPEYPKGITRDANYDLSVFKWGLNTLLQINKTLALNDPLAAQWKDALANLTPYPKDQNGYRIGRDADFSISHRHYSHLLQIYPIYEINWDQQQNRDLIQKSLSQWENNDAAWRGYSYTGAGSIYAMMGNGNKTHQLLNEMMKGKFSIKPNTMYLEAGPVIETPLSAVTTMNEMLLQSWNGIIRVFPAIPDAWLDASFNDLSAKGAFLVSGSRKAGKTQFIKIKSLRGSPCLVKTDLKGAIKSAGKRQFKMVQKESGVISIDLKAGEEVILYTAEEPAAFILEEVKSDGQNYWGLK